MYEGHRIGAILLMGGTGSRFGNDLPKQFHFLGQKKIYLHTLEVFSSAELFDEIVLVCHRDWVETVVQEAPNAKVVSGGSTRQDSSYLGLQGFSQRPDIVVIHDAVRPFVKKELLQENVRMAILHGAVDTCIASTDTVVHAPGGKRIESIPMREEYLRGQTPQTFRYEWVWEAHKAALREAITNASDDCRLVLRDGRAVHVVEGSEENLKITTEWDLVLATLHYERERCTQRE